MALTRFASYSKFLRYACRAEQCEVPQRRRVERDGSRLSWGDQRIHLNIRELEQSSSKSEVMMIFSFILVFFNDERITIFTPLATNSNANASSSPRKKPVPNQ
jgi:hypothetical protein